jgi:YD repeat-containing protein
MWSHVFHSSKSLFGRLRPALGYYIRRCFVVGSLALALAALWFRHSLGSIVYSEGFEYDSAGRVKTRTTGNGAKIRYLYNQAGRISGIQYPDRKAVSYGYDGAGNTIWVQDTTGKTEYKYDEFNRMQEVVTPRGHKVTYEYDP